MCFFGVCMWVWVHICIHFRIKMDLSECYKTHVDWCHFFSDLPPVFVDFWMLWSTHSINRSTRKSLGRVLICILLLGVQRWRTAAVRPLSTLSVAKTHNLLVLHWPLNFSAAQMPAAANVMAKAGSTGFVLDVILFSAAHGNPPPTQQSQTNDFDLSSAVRGRSYRYNPANDVKDLSAKLMNDKNSPPPSTPLLT